MRGSRVSMSRETWQAMLEANPRSRLLLVSTKTETGLLSALLRSLQVGPACPRRPRLRAALLAIVWILPSVWCAAQVVDHEFESDHPEERLVMSSGDRICGMSHDHGHWHSHPESSPVVSSEGAKKLDASALPSPVAVQGLSGATSRWNSLSALGPLVQAEEFASAPRAPPIS